MFQRVIPCVAAFWMQRNTTLSTEKSSFLIFFRARAHTHTHTHTWHFHVGVLSLFMGGIWTSLWFFIFPSSLPGGSFFGARFGGVGVSVLLGFCTNDLRLFLLYYCHWSESTLDKLKSVPRHCLWKNQSIPLVDQYNSNFGFRTIPVTKNQTKEFFHFDYCYWFPFFTTFMFCNGASHFRNLLSCI